MNLQLQTLRQTTLLILLFCSTFLLNAQSTFNQLYPTLTLVSANENTNNAVYLLSKAGTTYRVSIGINGNNAGFVIQTQANGILGQGTSSFNGTCEVISINKTEKGLLDLWQFAMDRVIIKNNQLALFSAAPSSNAKAKVVYLCQEKCDQELEEAIAADNNPESQPFFAIIGVGNGTCDTYVPCTQEALQSYEDCVCECVQDSRK